MVGALYCGEGFLQFQLDTLKCMGKMRQNVENKRKDMNTFAMECISHLQIINFLFCDLFLIKGFHNY